VSAQLDLLRPPPDPAPPVPITPRVDRRRKARAIQESGACRWILAGKPIALEVARLRGEVTAETFRAAAEKLNALPPTYGEQRALSWIPSMFYQLCRDGELRKRRRVDGSVIKVYSEGQGNDQVVYELVESAR
jgi:hypothetical protein